MYNFNPFTSNFDLTELKSEVRQYEVASINAGLVSFATFAMNPNSLLQMLVYHLAKASGTNEFYATFLRVSFYRGAVGAPASLGSTLSTLHENFTVNPSINTGVSGNDVVLSVASGTIQTINWFIKVYPQYYEFPS